MEEVKRMRPRKQALDYFTFVYLTGGVSKKEAQKLSIHMAEIVQRDTNETAQTYWSQVITELKNLPIK